MRRKHSKLDQDNDDAMDEDGNDEYRGDGDGVDDHENGACIPCHMQLCLGQSPKSESSTSRYLLGQPLSYELYDGQNSDGIIYISQSLLGESNQLQIQIA